MYNHYVIQLNDNMNLNACYGLPLKYAKRIPFFVTRALSVLSREYAYLERRLPIHMRSLNLNIDKGESQRLHCLHNPCT